MRTIHFFRHGQAGLRNDYDTLSDLGLRQSQELGHYLAQTRRVPFSRAVVGGMKRQQATLEEVRRMYVIAGEDFPEPEIDPGWSEFDLDGVCSAYAPQLAAHDPEFERQHSEMVAATRHADSHLHRQWLPCDSMIIAAWLEERFPFSGESWIGFQKRIRETFERLLDADTKGNIAVFTSATPVGLSISHTLGIEPRMALRLAGAQYNTNITTIRVEGREPHLVGFNATPHLSSPAMQTLR